MVEQQNTSKRMKHADGLPFDTHIEIIQGKLEMRNWSREKKYKQGLRVAFVPTMGFLHEGHLGLVQKASEMADVVVVSIYVNPAQFSPTEDFGIYPRSLPEDVAKLEQYEKVKAVFVPKTLYTADLAVQKVDSKSRSQGEHQTWVRVEQVEKPLCGKSRPHFFRGVATVLVKLFNIVEPDMAIFGQKDYQQLKVTEIMVKELDFDVKIIGAPIAREPGGLAMSSRNALLSEQGREAAQAIYRSLTNAQKSIHEGQREVGDLISEVKESVKSAGGTIDYVEIVDPNCLKDIHNEVTSDCVMAIAAKFEKVRLIDNMLLRVNKDT